MEFSISPGIIFTTENNATHYKSGTEVYVDFAVNQFVSDNVALGMKGYYLKQITGDSGKGALLGDFKGEAFSLGPGFVWVPKSGGGRVTILGNWLHDFYADNRFETDTVTFTAAWTF